MWSSAKGPADWLVTLEGVTVVDVPIQRPRTENAILRRLLPLWLLTLLRLLLALCFTSLGRLLLLRCLLPLWFLALRPVPPFLLLFLVSERRCHGTE